MKKEKKKLLSFLGSCQEAFAAGDTGDGEKTLYTAESVEFSAFCSFSATENTGLLHLKKDAIRSNAALDFNRLVSDFTRVSLVFFRDHHAYRGDLKRQDGQALTIFKTSYAGFTQPQNGKNGDNYMFLGINRVNEAVAGQAEGFALNGADCTFTNLDGAGNSYFAFFTEMSERFDFFGFVRNCLRNNLIHQTHTGLGERYRFFTEAHFGGNGAIITSDEMDDYETATIGLYFHYGKKELIILLNNRGGSRGGVF